MRTDFGLVLLEVTTTMEVKTVLQPYEMVLERLDSMDEKTHWKMIAFGAFQLTLCLYLVIHKDVRA